MREALVCLVVVLGTPIVAAAQAGGFILPPGSALGKRVTVTTTTGEQFRGRLLDDAGGALVLESGGGKRRIPHPTVERVTRRHNRFLFGPLIGLGAGLAVGVPLKQRWDNEGGNGDAWLTLFVGIGVATGTAIDLANGSDRTIYERRPGPAGRLQILPLRRGAAARWAIDW
jgi:hypothetical protein